MKTRTTLLGASLLLLLAVSGGLYFGGAKSEIKNTQPKAARPTPTLTATAVSQAKAHPAEAHLNEMGLTSTAGIGVRVEAASLSEGGNQ